LYIEVGIYGGLSSFLLSGFSSFCGGFYCLVF